MPENMTRPSTFGDFINIQESDKEAYNFFSAKLQYTDSEISDVTAYVASFILHTTDPSGTAKLVDYIVDFLCYSFKNAEARS